MTKRPITLSLNADLIEAARAHGLNLSAITEDARRWLAENNEAIAVQNDWTAEHGLFSDEFRGW